MKWTNVKLIFQREVRDQLRDRRTLFTILVLPLLLYPLLGMSMLQVAQFMREHPTKIWVIGTDELPAEPELLAHDQFSPSLAGDVDLRLLELEIAPSLPSGVQPEELYVLAQKKIRDGQFDAVVFFPPQFRQQLDRFWNRLQQRQVPDERPETLGIPEPRIFVNMANDKSRIAYDRVRTIIGNWRDAVVHDNLVRHHLPPNAAEPFQVVGDDVADEGNHRAAIWSKILPFVVLIWALTGAFYPAVDLCAGEKERGTLETLLSSPAERHEIVWGKLLTTMLFSCTTSVLHLLSMTLTGVIIMGQIDRLGSAEHLAALGPPPLAPMGWLLLALLPLSALFSALSLAIAAFARSSKEGQYYVMPLLMITLPLMMLPMLPATELDLGTSLIPVTGVLLLLRSLIEGRYAEALVYAPPVVAVTISGCLLAIRWAVEQFNNESVLFRESERFGLGLWLRHLMRDRGDMPTFGEALLCGIVLLMINFFSSMYVGTPTNWNSMVTVTVVMQLALIATPALLMATILTRRPTRALMLRPCRPLALPAALLLAVVLHPTAMLLGQWIQSLYPISEDAHAQLKWFSGMLDQVPLMHVLLVFALTPAICEELAFRGFILSGFRQMGHRWSAIALSSIFFGVTHGMLQQSLMACAIGAVIGYVVVQTGSLLPGMLFHMTHNALSLSIPRISPEMYERYEGLHVFFRWENEQLVYQAPIVAFGAIFAGVILLWFRSFPSHVAPLASSPTSIAPTPAACMER